MADFYKDIRRHAIFAIVGNDEDDKTVYVGKTCARNPRSVLYAHRKGRRVLTRDDFGPEGISDHLDFYILEVLNCTGATAFKHVVAWYRYFEENRFIALGNCRMGDMSGYLLEETQEIYLKVCEPVSLETVFNREVEEPPEPLPAQEGSGKKPSASVQLNVRVTQDTADSFREFCLESGASQNEALALLLSDRKVKAEKVLLDYIRYHRGTAKKRDEENKELLRKNADLQHKGVAYRKAYGALVGELVSRVQPRNFNGQEAMKPVQLKRLRFGMRGYEYPTTSACSLITLEEVVWGKTSKPHAALFLLGREESGTAIKLRYYPKADYIGVAPTHQSYAHRGAKWLVSYVVSTDGAVDLVAGVPLEGFEKKAVWEAESPKRRVSLEQRMADANRRSGC